MQSVQVIVHCTLFCLLATDASVSLFCCFIVVVVTVTVVIIISVLCTLLVLCFVAVYSFSVFSIFHALYIHAARAQCSQ